jgi:hypothetical protein
MDSSNRVIDCFACAHLLYEEKIKKNPFPEDGYSIGKAREFILDLLPGCKDEDVLAIYETAIHCYDGNIARKLTPIRPHFSSR